MTRKEIFEKLWISVTTKKLPKDNQEILFCTKTNRIHIGVYHDDGSRNPWFSYCDGRRVWSDLVTAWMPKPVPYQAESEDK